MTGLGGRATGMLAAGMLSATVAGGAWAQSPPIFQPGAPGAGAATISAERSVAMSRGTFTAGDAAFMQHMIVHHRQAVDMVALLVAQGADPTVRRLGERIAASQEAEMALMREWLEARGQPLEMPGMAGGHAGHAGMDHSAMGHGASAPPADDTPVMPGMLSPRQMRALTAARGPAFDRLFLEGMIRHHQGALDMVEGLMARPDSAEDPMLSEFASSVVADQSAEILRMQTLLSNLSTPRS